MARRVSRGLLSTSRASTTNVHQRQAKDDFGEMPERRRDAEKQARAKGHTPGPWKKRKSDVYGRQDSYCLTCNQIVTVAVEEPTPYDLPLVYGGMLTTECKEKGK
jgi:hypothetical protein